MTKSLTIMGLVSVLSLAGSAWAGSSDMNKLQCGAKAIELGMSANDIKMTCGQNWEPSYISRHTRPAVGTNDTAEQSNDQFEKWMYRTTGNDDTHVILKNDEVIRIFTMVQQ